MYDDGVINEPACLCGPLEASDEDEDQSINFYLGRGNTAFSERDNETLTFCFEVSVCLGTIRLKDPSCLDFEGLTGSSFFTLEIVLKDYLTLNANKMTYK